jgi:hypothetical protein
MNGRRNMNNFKYAEKKHEYFMKNLDWRGYLHYLAVDLPQIISG